MIGYPKKQGKKKRKIHRASILQKRKYCYLCEKEARMITTGLHDHHIFGGIRRSLSEEYGLKVWLCSSHHIYGPAAVHVNKDIRQQLQAEAEKAFIKAYPNEDFLTIFGKNYIE